MPLTATPTSHLSVQRPYTAHGYGQTTAAPSVLFRQPLSLYGSPSSTISALPHDKDLAHTPPPLDLCRRNSEASIYDQTMPYYLPPGHSNLFAPPYMPGSDYASIRPDGHIKKRSRTAQACEKCRIRKAKVSRPAAAATPSCLLIPHSVLGATLVPDVSTRNSLASFPAPLELAEQLATRVNTFL